MSNIDDNHLERPARESRVTFKATETEKRNYERVSIRLDKHMSDWIRKVLNAAVAEFDEKNKR